MHVRRRWCLYLIVLLLLCLYSVATVFCAAQPSALRETPPPPPLASPLVSPSPQCDACRNFVQCELAVRGGPGKFCNDVTPDRIACCCPVSARCVWNETRCVCDEMVFGKYTPLAVVLGAIIWLVVSVHRCVCPPPPISNRNGTSISTRVVESSRVRPDNTGRNYGSMALNNETP